MHRSTGPAPRRIASTPAGSAAAGLVSADLPDALPPDTVAVHVGTLGLVLEPMAAAIERLVADVAANVLVWSIPTSGRPRSPTNRPTAAGLRRSSHRADVVKASVDDVSWLEPDLDPAEAARRLVADGIGSSS